MRENGEFNIGGESVEVTNFGAEVFAGLESLECASIAFTAVIWRSIAPPRELRLRPLQREEDNDARDGNAAGPGG